jgi:acetyl esterase
VSVVGVDYPLAPETPFPTGLEETREAIALCVTEGIADVLPPARRHVLSGDSSGANLAVAIALGERDAGGPVPAAMILNYGVYDCDFARASYAAYGREPYQLTTAKMETFWSHYCADPADRANALASPLRADLAGLCPCQMVIAGHDILRDENLAFARALDAAGVPVDVDFHSDAPHAFLEAFAFSEEPMATIRRSGDWLRARFATSG